MFTMIVTTMIHPPARYAYHDVPRSVVVRGSTTPDFLPVSMGLKYPLVTFIG